MWATENHLLENKQVVIGDKKLPTEPKKMISDFCWSVPDLFGLCPLKMSPPAVYGVVMSFEHFQSLQFEEVFFMNKKHFMKPNCAFFCIIPLIIL